MQKKTSKKTPREKRHKTIKRRKKLPQQQVPNNETGEVKNAAHHIHGSRRARHPSSSWRPQRGSPASGHTPAHSSRWCCSSLPRSSSRYTPWEPWWHCSPALSDHNPTTKGWKPGARRTAFGSIPLGHRPSIIPLEHAFLFARQRSPRDDLAIATEAHGSPLSEGRAGKEEGGRTASGVVEGPAIHQAARERRGVEWQQDVAWRAAHAGATAHSRRAVPDISSGSRGGHAPRSCAHAHGDCFYRSRDIRFVSPPSLLK